MTPELSKRLSIQVDTPRTGATNDSSECAERVVGRAPPHEDKMPHVSKALGVIVGLIGVLLLIPGAGALNDYVGSGLPRDLVVPMVADLLISAVCLIAAFRWLRADVRK